MRKNRKGFNFFGSANALFAVAAIVLPLGASSFAVATGQTREEIARSELQRQCRIGLIAGGVAACTGMEPLCEGFARLTPDRSPMRTDTLFDVASLTKTFTAAICANLAADGIVDVDVPFVRYLPECAVGPECRITMRDLSLHRSGFETDTSIVAGSPDPAEFRRRVLAHRPKNPHPGNYLYSCHNYILLGMIAERVTGKSLDRLGKELVFGPLGMKDTSWGPVPDDGRPMRCAYRNIEPGRIIDCIAGKISIPIGNAGVFTTVGDVTLFLKDLLARKTFKPLVYDLLLSEDRCADGVKRSFGLAMNDAARPDGVSVRGAWHTGSTGQTMLVDPETGFWAVVLTSRAGADGIAGHDACIVARRELIGALASKTEFSALRREIASPATRMAAIQRALTSDSEHARRFALWNLFVDDRNAAFAWMEANASDGGRLVGLLMAELGQQMPADRRTAFFEKLSSATGDSAVKLACSKALGFPFHRNNLPVSQNPVNDHPVKMVAAFDLPKDGWRFHHDRFADGHRGPSACQTLPEKSTRRWLKIGIGSFWEDFPGVGKNYNGIGWYRLEWRLPEKPAGANVFELCFDGVDEEAWVWINGEYVGQHAEGPIGWNRPFRFDVAKELKWNATNVLVVRVNDTANGGGIYKGIRLEAMSCDF